MEQKDLEEQKDRMYATLFGRKEEREITHRDVEAIQERIGIEVPFPAYKESILCEGFCIRLF